VRAVRIRIHERRLNAAKLAGATEGVTKPSPLRINASVLRMAKDSSRRFLAPFEELKRDVDGPVLARNARDAPDVGAL